MDSLAFQDDLAKNLWEHHQWEPGGPYLDLVISISSVLEKHVEAFDQIQFGFVAHYGESCSHTIDDWYENKWGNFTYCHVCDETYEEPYC